MAKLTDFMKESANDKVEIKSQVKLNGQPLKTFKAFKEEFGVEEFATVIQTRNIGGDTMIWGNTDFAIWGTSSWGSSAQTSFILGSSLAGVLGTSKLGSRSSEFEDTIVVNPDRKHKERFFGTYFNSTSDTTATWVGDGEVTYTASQVAQSNIIYKNNETITSATLNAIESTGDVNYYLASYDNTTPTPPIIHFNMNDDLATTNVVESISGNDGTANFNTEDNSVVGKVNKALSFNGTGDYVNLGSTADGNYTSMTISAWIKRTGDTPATWSTHLHRGPTTAVGTSVFFIGTEATTHNIVSTIGAGASGPSYLSGDTNVFTELDTWYHVLTSWDGTTARVYVDNIEKVSYALSAANFTAYTATQGSAITRIGASGNASGYLVEGEIDDVRIYDTALTVDEVSAIYNSGAGTEIDDPTYWESVTSGTLHNFSSTGKKLKWKAQEADGTNAITTYIEVIY